MKNLSSMLTAFLMLVIAIGCRKNDLSTPTPEVAGETSTVSIMGTGKKVRDIIKPGGDFWFSGNFNQTYGLNPGDTVVLKAGTYGHIDITTIDGITFINEGQVIAHSWNFNRGAKNVRVIGTGTPGIKYGIKFTGTNFYACDWKAVGDLEIAGVETAGCPIGFLVQTDPTLTWGSPNQNVYIHDNYVHDTKYEAMYIGHDALGGPWINGKIHNNIIKNAANDGIQTRNGYFDIQNNELDGIGLANNNWHTHGILIGGNTKNSLIKGNTVKNCPNGYGIFINGYGDHVIECNNITSGSTAIAMSNTASREDLQKVGYQNYYIRNNSLISTNFNTLECYRDPAGVAVTLTFTGNKTSGPNNIDSNIPVTQSGNGPNVTPSCGATTPPPAPTNQAPVANAGADKVITLPTASLTLAGTGTDADGTIASYAWTKVSGPTGGTIASAAAAQTLISALIQGTYVFQLKVTDNKGATATDNVTVTVNGVTTPPPTGGTTIKVEAESYAAMKGVSTLTGAGGFKYIGDVETTDWMDYNVNVPSAGSYTIKLRVATPHAGKKLEIRNASGTVLTTVSLPQSGSWTTFVEATSTLTLPAGSQKLRIYAATSYNDVDWFELRKN